MQGEQEGEIPKLFGCSSQSIIYHPSHHQSIKKHTKTLPGELRLTGRVSGILHSGHLGAGAGEWRQLSGLKHSSSSPSALSSSISSASQCLLGAFLEGFRLPRFLHFLCLSFPTYIFGEKAFWEEFYQGHMEIFMTCGMHFSSLHGF